MKWYAENSRNYPWRKTDNAFHILIAEKLLQQTRARQAVVDAYQKITSTYQSIDELADAELGDLQRIIQPLGLLYRAAELINLASEIKDHFNYVVPNKFEELLTLTGVGEYSARAVMSFAYNQDISIVDTNVARFLHRLLGLDENIPKNPARSKRLRFYAEYMVPRGNSRNYNYSVLDLCSKICTSSKPSCSECPVQKFCKFGIYR